MERNSRTSLYEKLYNEIKQEIICGKLKEGAKLPSKRAQAERLGISVVTVENAYAQLLAEGYIAARERSGYYVCAAEFPAPQAAETSAQAENDERESLKKGAQYLLRFRRAVLRSFRRLSQLT